MENLSIGNWVQVKKKVSQINEASNYVMIRSINDNEFTVVFLLYHYVGRIEKFKIEDLEGINISFDNINLLADEINLEEENVENLTGCKLYSENKKLLALCITGAYEFEYAKKDNNKSIVIKGDKMLYFHEVQNYINKTAP